MNQKLSRERTKFAFSRIQKGNERELIEITHASKKADGNDVKTILM
jgi:hypothetical protein